MARARTGPQQPTPERQLVSLAEAADFADVSTKTMRRWIAAGQITGYRAGARLIKVDLREVDTFVRPIPTADGGEVA